MDYIYVGQIVNTHGRKGEVRILSDFKYKDLVFKKGFKLYVGRFKDELLVRTYRVHKNYDMVTFDDIENINDVIMYKGDDVYINKKDIKIDGYFNEDIIGLNAYIDNVSIGKVEYILENKAHEILVIVDKDGKHMIPYVDEFVGSIDLDNNRINIINVEGILNEN